MTKTFNRARTARMRLKSDSELTAIVKSGSLSSAAAQYELERRFEAQRSK